MNYKAEVEAFLQSIQGKKRLTAQENDMLYRLHNLTHPHSKREKSTCSGCVKTTLNRLRTWLSKTV
jgi:hypothetical protein